MSENDLTVKTESDKEIRLDIYLFREGIVPSRNIARDEIEKGNVRVNSKTVSKPGFRLRISDKVEYSGDPHEYVSRGAYKLIAALEEFGIRPEGRICLDVGSSTGGFTQVLLKNGAEKVVAIDVGHGQLDEKIKNDPKVISIEGFNFRDTNEAEKLLSSYSFSVIVCDVSFISLKLLKESFRLVFKDDTEGVLLIKPQFEAGRSALNDRGIVTDEKDHERAIDEVREEYEKAGFDVLRIIPSPIKGGDGNKEYLMYIKCRDAHNIGIEDIHT